jgi:hypothetical protein
MKEGAWIEAASGRWHWIDEHADWIRRPECARRAGLEEEAVLQIAAMPRKQASGPERTAILLEAMKHGLIRFRAHGADGVTFESTLPLLEAMAAASNFMEENLGPLTMVRFNRLPVGGPCVAMFYKDLVAALRGDGPISLCQGARDGAP